MPKVPQSALHVTDRSIYELDDLECFLDELVRDDQTRIKLTSRLE